jgi:hypothetical protein
MNHTRTRPSIPEYCVPGIIFTNQIEIGAVVGKARAGGVSEPYPSREVNLRLTILEQWYQMLEIRIIKCPIYTRASR